MSAPEQVQAVRERFARCGERPIPISPTIRRVGETRGCGLVEMENATIAMLLQRVIAHPDAANGADPVNAVVLIIEVEHRHPGMVFGGGAA